MSEARSQEDLAYLSATEQLALFRSRDLSPVEVLQAQIARADALAETVNALTWRFNERALEQAKAAEARYLGQGDAPRALEGITLAIKEEMGVAGDPVTSASLAFKDAIAGETAPLAERAMAAGAIVHARTTQPEFACAAFSQSKMFGITRNPWNQNFDVGGSSGGAGASLAAGLTTIAGGSDIGGSIRIPASCNGVVGFKPPYGRVPQQPPFNLDHYCHEGPMTRTIADCALFENIISGPSPIDIASLRERVELPLDPGGVAGLRVAVSVDLGSWDVEDDVKRNTLRAADALRAAGATVENTDFALDKDEVFEVAHAHLGAIFGASLATLLEEHRDVMTSYAIAFAKDQALAQPVSLLEGMEREGAITRALGELLEEYDALICPTLSMPALPVDLPWTITLPNGTISSPLQHLMTMPFNIASRCPVLNVPSGFADNGVPTGVQLVGRTFDDLTSFRLGAALERANLWNYATMRPDLAV
ncbi:MAG: amidase [Chloroflexia bacterium]|nr:amidase [Chloroflexia bacterium]